MNKANKAETGEGNAPRVYVLTDGIEIFRSEIFNEYQIGVAQRTAQRETGGNLFWREVKEANQ